MKNRQKANSLNIRGFLKKEPIQLLIFAVLSYGVARGVFTFFAGEAFRFEWLMLRLLPLAFAGSALYVFFGSLEPEERPGRPQFHPQRWVEIFFSLGVVAFIHFRDPMLWVDDAGFILRYLDNVDAGCFYCFNVQDGPVFGISSFLFGILTSLVTFLGASPATSILLVTYTGLFFSAFLLFRIIRKVIAHPSLAFFIWLFVLTFSKAWWAVANSGMESPLHLAVCLAAIWYFLEGKSRGMWFFCALAVISKLDAVPVAAATGIFWLLGNGRKLLPVSFRNKEVQDLVFFGILPVLAFVAFTFLLFGSPLPQSAYAKVYLHSHPEDHWFPFLTWFTEDPMRIPAFWVFLTSFILHHLILFVFRDRAGRKHLLPGWAFAGVMLLYFFYNPGEKMVWYYVLPEILMLLQTGISVVFILERLLARGAFVGLHLFFGIWFLLLWTHMLYEVRWFRKYERIVEVERNMVGEYVAGKTTANDTLLAGHGLIGAYTDAYVIDLTGLNSRLAASYELDDMRMIRELKPGWIAMHSWPRYLETAPVEGYVEDTVFYDITLHGYPAWRVWRRAKPGEAILKTVALDSSVISGDSLNFQSWSGVLRVQGKTITLPVPPDIPPASHFELGIYRKDSAFQLVADRFHGDSLLASDILNIAGKPAKQGPPYHSQALQFDLFRDSLRVNRIKLYLKDSDEGIEIVDPVSRIPVPSI